jgi:hypothetical protein
MEINLPWVRLHVYPHQFGNPIFFQTDFIHLCGIVWQNMSNHNYCVMPNTNVLHWAMWTYTSTELLYYIFIAKAMLVMIGYKYDSTGYNKL